MNKYDGLKYKQNLPLLDKILLTRARLREFYNKYYGKIYISFSGGKDSTVLLHIARGLYPNIKAVFADTGMEYPEIRDFVKLTGNVDWIKPEMPFKKVIEKYGYPLISKDQSKHLHEIRQTKSAVLRNTLLNGNRWGQGKISAKWLFMMDAPFKVSHKCCDVMKKLPFKKYEKETGLRPVIGLMAEESNMRLMDVAKFGCNIFDGKRPISRPMSFWTEKDVWEYLRTYNVPYSKIYDMGYKRTGCMFCGYGIQYEFDGSIESRFDRMAVTHPKQHDYIMREDGLDLANMIKYMKAGLSK